MTKAEQLLQAIETHSSFPAENPELILQYLQDALEKNEPLTFFSWKMFMTTFAEGQVTAHYHFDTNEAETYVQSEKKFLGILETFGVPFKYAKIIPDELAEMFWGINNPAEAENYARQVEEFFESVYTPTHIYLLSQLTAEHQLQDLYEQDYATVLNSFNDQGQSPLIDPSKYQTEIDRRMQFHKLSAEDRELAEQLAQKAFALFAAETNVLWQLSVLDVLPRLVMLSSSRSNDMYKHDFYKNPPERPILPKLFVT
jgi:hypothetical protein